MTNLTTTEQREALERTIAATQANIDQQEQALTDLKAVHRANLSDLREVQRKERLEQSPAGRWGRAIKSLRREGVTFRSNVRQCCRGCIEPGQLGLASYDDKTPYGYTFGGQGAAILFEPDGEVRATEKGWSSVRGQKPTHAYINHGNGAGERIAAAFRAEGFEVAWDGTENDTVTVTL